MRSRCSGQHPGTVVWLTSVDPWTVSKTHEALFALEHELPKTFPGHMWAGLVARWAVHHRVRAAAALDVGHGWLSQLLAPVGHWG